MAGKTKADGILLAIVIALLATGTVAFLSASLGFVARGDEPLGRIYLTQIGIGLLGGLALLFAAKSIVTKQRLIAAIPWLYGIAIALMGVMFLSPLGQTIKGATRWIDLGITTFQPSEVLKIATVLAVALAIATMREKGRVFSKEAAILVAVLALPLALIALEPDVDTFLILAGSCLVMYFAGGGSIRALLALAGVGVAVIAILFAMRPYLADRVFTFLDPSRDPTGAGYQVQQALIAVGSGELFGRGPGQSVQKFDYLPEPLGDSIYAVVAEETGFLGATLLALLFLAFLLRSYALAASASDAFAALAIAGLASLIGFQAFLNMAAMTGLAPLSGNPLPLVSHGGTALLVTLASIGIILGLSRGGRTRSG